MNRSLRMLAVGVALAGLAVACTKVPYTDRRQFNAIPKGVMNQLGKSTYSSMLSGVQVQRRGQEAQMLTNVGNRISRAANQPSYDWSFALIQDDAINAWALPGGYIGFYTGILPVLRNEAGMAFVMGHEVGHAVANHGAERLSQNLALLGGLAGLNAYLAGRTELSPEQRALVVGALGVGAQFGVLLPFSRAHEAEADVIGMMYMARAGYPPDESVKVWDRMGQATGGARVPAFLSTHPSHARRQDNLRKWMPQATRRYERNRLSHDTTQTLWGGDASRGGRDARGRGGGESRRDRGGSPSREDRARERRR